MVPYLMIVLLFPCGFIQIHIPGCKKDLPIHGKHIDLLTYPIAPQGEMVYPLFYYFDLTKTITDEEDSLQLKNLGIKKRVHISKEQKALYENLTPAQFTDFMDEFGEEY